MRIRVLPVFIYALSVLVASSSHHLSAQNTVAAEKNIVPGAGRMDQYVKKLEGKNEEKGLTLIPTLLFINYRGLAKMENAMGKGKKLHDKPDSIRERDAKRELNRIKLK